MEATTNKSRTREEVIAWWQRAKKRKAEWEEKKCRRSLKKRLRYANRLKSPTTMI